MLIDRVSSASNAVATIVSAIALFWLPLAAVTVPDKLAGSADGSTVITWLASDAGVPAASVTSAVTA
jgi:hypothetical protein